MPLQKDDKKVRERLQIQIKADNVSDEAIVEHWLSVWDKIAKLENAEKPVEENYKEAE